MTSIISGVNDIMERALGARFKTKTGARNISASVDWTNLFDSALEKIAENWEARSDKERQPSSMNWTLRKQTPPTAEHNSSQEVVLERRIASLENWNCQIPTASGVMGSHTDKRRSIDLAHEASGGVYELIELKIASNNPADAAMEVLSYGLIYRFMRNILNLAALSPEQHGLLEAKTLRLVVLAPHQYYDGTYDLAAIQDGLNEALASQAEPTMTFCFQRFPTDFDVMSEDPQVLREALSARQSYPFL